MTDRDVAALPWTWGSKITDQLLRDGLRRVEVLFQGDVLDLGCGGKPYRAIVGSSATHWIGLDRPVAAAGRPQAEVFGTATALPFRQNSFDVVLCTQVLEHIRTPLQTLAQAYLVLKPGGSLVLTTPQTNPLHEEPADYFRFTNHGLTFLAQEAGLDVVSVEPLGGAIATIAQMVVWHANWIRRIPLLGPAMHAAANASIGWLGLKLDFLSHLYGRGAEKDTLNWLLIARKPLRC